MPKQKRKAYRESYFNLFRLRLLLGVFVPWIALSASLTPAEQTELVNNLGFKIYRTMERPANRYVYCFVVLLMYCFMSLFHVMFHSPLRLSINQLPCRSNIFLDYGTFSTSFLDWIH